MHNRLPGANIAYVFGLRNSNKTELSKHIWKLKENNQDYNHQMVNFKTRYFVHRGIKTLQFMFGRKILHFERHKQR